MCSVVERKEKRSVTNSIRHWNITNSILENTRTRCDFATRKSLFACAESSKRHNLDASSKYHALYHWNARTRRDRVTLKSLFACVELSKCHELHASSKYHELASPDRQTDRQAGCCSLKHCVAAWNNVLQPETVCCSLKQCVAESDAVSISRTSISRKTDSRCDAVCSSMLQSDTI